MMTHTFNTVARYAETDMMGVIHHSVYLVWAEAARMDMMDEMGYTYTETEKSGIMLPVTEVKFSYKAPSFFEDKIRVECAVTHMDNRRLRIDYQIKAGDRLCCTGYTKHIFMNAASRTSMRIPTEVLDKFKEYYTPEFEQTKK